ncbi:hypothetical protein D9M72_552930 [compost metagenome]
MQRGHCASNASTNLDTASPKLECQPDFFDRLACKLGQRLNVIYPGKKYGKFIPPKSRDYAIGMERFM